MNRIRLTLFCLGVLAALVAVIGLQEAAACDPPTTPAAAEKHGEWLVSGPYSHDNLSVYLIHGPDRLAGRHYLTLQEALEQKKVIVHETGNVNELAVENIGDIDVYIQAGDIVRGGQQDRTLGNDLVLAARSGRVPIASYCVEQGRWSARAGEAVAHFSSSGNCLSSNELKLAVKVAGSQGRVWSSVAKQQRDLEENVGGSVRPVSSPSSLELTLDDRKVQAARDRYAQKMDKLVDHRPDIVGFVFAVNGELTCGDVYAGPSLLKQLWPKLIESAVVEAVSKRQDDVLIKVPAVSEVKKFLIEAEQAQAQQRDASSRTRLVTRDSGNSVLFETIDSNVPAAPLHRNYLSNLGAAPDPAEFQTPQMGPHPEHQQQRIERPRGAKDDGC